VLQNLLPLLPRRFSAIGLAFAAAFCVAGLGFWLLGARFSRPMLALAATVGGGAIGFNLPHWFGWSIDPWSVCVLGALLLGTFGFLAHAYLAAIGLGLLLSTWAVLTALAAQGPLTPWQWPTSLTATTTPTFSFGLPQLLPEEISTPTLAAAAVSLFVGFTLALMFRRLGAVLFWSILGLSLILLTSLAAAQSAGPQYLQFIPPRATFQGLIVAALIAIGSAVQWKIAFPKRPIIKPAE
jgi:hypothetical protein